MVRAGVLVTVNSDDPPMFGTDLNTEYAIAARLLDLDEAGVAGPGEERGGRLVPRRGREAAAAREIDAYLTDWPRQAVNEEAAAPEPGTPGRAPPPSLPSYGQSAVMTCLTRV